MRPVVLILAVAVLLVGSVAQAQDDQAKRDNAASHPNVVHGAPIIAGTSCDSIDVTGVTSHAALGDPSNTVISQDYSAGPCLAVDDIGWTAIMFEAFSPSWGSEATLEVSASDGSSASSIQFFPGDNTPGVKGPVSGSTGAPVVLLGDQILRLEFWESFDDGAIDPDGMYQSGSIDPVGAVIPVELQGFSIE